MDRTIGMAATLLGLSVRGLWVVVKMLPQLFGLGLVVYGIWLFDSRVALIVLGLFLFLVAPKPQIPDRRK